MVRFSFRLWVFFFSFFELHVIHNKAPNHQFILPPFSPVCRPLFLLSLVMGKIVGAQFSSVPLVIGQSVIAPRFSVRTMKRVGIKNLIWTMNQSHVSPMNPLNKSEWFRGISPQNFFLKKRETPRRQSTNALAPTMKRIHMKKKKKKQKKKKYIS